MFYPSTTAFTVLVLDIVFLSDCADVEDERFIYRTYKKSDSMTPSNARPIYSL